MMIPAIIGSAVALVTNYLDTKNKAQLDGKKQQILHSAAGQSAESVEPLCVANDVVQNPKSVASSAYKKADTAYRDGIKYAKRHDAAGMYKFAKELRLLSKSDAGARAKLNDLLNTYRKARDSEVKQFELANCK